MSGMCDLPQISNYAGLNHNLTSIAVKTLQAQKTTMQWKSDKKFGIGM
jgi:hypothetical protein